MRQLHIHSTYIHSVHYTVCSMYIYNIYIHSILEVKYVCMCCMVDDMEESKDDSVVDDSVVDDAY